MELYNYIAPYMLGIIGGIALGLFIVWFMIHINKVYDKNYSELIEFMNEFFTEMQRSYDAVYSLTKVKFIDGMYDFKIIKIVQTNNKPIYTAINLYVDLKLGLLHVNMGNGHTSNLKFSFEGMEDKYHYKLKKYLTNELVNFPTESHMEICEWEHINLKVKSLQNLIREYGDKENMVDYKNTFPDGKFDIYKVTKTLFIDEFVKEILKLIPSEMIVKYKAGTITLNELNNMKLKDLFPSYPIKNNKIYFEYLIYDITGLIKPMYAAVEQSLSDFMIFCYNHSIKKHLELSKKYMIIKFSYGLNDSNFKKGVLIMIDPADKYDWLTNKTFKEKFDLPNQQRMLDSDLKEIFDIPTNLQLVSVEDITKSVTYKELVNMDTKLHYVSGW